MRWLSKPPVVSSSIYNGNIFLIRNKFPSKSMILLNCTLKLIKLDEVKHKVEIFNKQQVYNKDCKSKIISVGITIEIWHIMSMVNDVVNYTGGQFY